MADKKPTNEVPETAASDPVANEPDKPLNPPASTQETSRLDRFKAWYKSNKKLSIPASVLLVIILILAVPWSRYNSLGLVLKKNYQLQVIDNETKSPVSGATVSIGSASDETDGNGLAQLKSVKVGPHKASVSKKYYKDGQLSVIVPILSEKSKPSIDLVATGRQVKISIINTINKKPIKGVNIKVADITAQTDSSGNATVVLPPGVPQQNATLSLDGYNPTDVTLKVSDQKVEENNLKLTPAGKVYFLSKRTGKIDVMKANLDGSGQAVVAAGTGKESDTDTILLASRDWKYLAFKSKRDDGLPKLYWIDTSVDKLNILDEGDADFTMIGWGNDTFIYKVSRNGVASWQPNHEALKSFNAQSAKLLILNQTGGSGSNDSDFAHESYDANQYLIDTQLIFSKSWNSGYMSSAIVGKQAGMYSISIDGTGFKTLKSFNYDGPGSYYYLSSVLYDPKVIYYLQYGNAGQHYYKFINGSVAQDDTLADAYNKFVDTNYPTYLLSPTGKQTFWIESRDGKSALLVGDSNGDNSKTAVALPDDYQNYGWYSDDYLFVSKKSSELYVLPVSGAKAESDLLKITDYHKPAYRFYGYGGGYGGL